MLRIFSNVFFWFRALFPSTICFCVVNRADYSPPDATVSRKRLLHLRTGRLRSEFGPSQRIPRAFVILFLFFFHHIFVFSTNTRHQRCTVGYSHRPLVPHAPPSLRRNTRGPHSPAYRPPSPIQKKIPLHYTIGPTGCFSAADCVCAVAHARTYTRTYTHTRVRMFIFIYAKIRFKLTPGPRLKQYLHNVCVCVSALPADTAGDPAAGPPRTALTERFSRRRGAYFVGNDHQ